MYVTFADLAWMYLLRSKVNLEISAPSRYQEPANEVTNLSPEMCPLSYIGIVHLQWYLGIGLGIGACVTSEVDLLLLQSLTKPEIANSVQAVDISRYSGVIAEGYLK